MILTHPSFDSAAARVFSGECSVTRDHERELRDGPPLSMLVVCGRRDAEEIEVIRVVRVACEKVSP